MSTAGRSNRGQPGTLWQPGRFDSVIGSPASPVDVTITNGYQYYFTNASPTHYWDLAIDGEWVEFHDGALHITDLLLTNDAILRFDYDRRGTDSFDMDALTVSRSIAVNDGDMICIAQGKLRKKRVGQLGFLNRPGAAQLKGDGLAAHGDGFGQGADRDCLLAAGWREAVQKIERLGENKGRTRRQCPGVIGSRKL